MKLHVPWDNGEKILDRYTIDSSEAEGGVSPLVSVSDLPEGTQSVMIDFTDPYDSAGVNNPGGGWNHWRVLLPSEDPHIAEGSSGKEKRPHGATVFPNSWGHAYYQGPAAAEKVPPPPSTLGESMYNMRAIALNLSPAGIKKQYPATEHAPAIGTILEQLKDHIIGEPIVVIGRYTRKGVRETLHQSGDGEDD